MVKHSSERMTHLTSCPPSMKISPAKYSCQKSIRALKFPLCKKCKSWRNKLNDSKSKQSDTYRMWNIMQKLVGIFKILVSLKKKDGEDSSRIRNNKVMQQPNAMHAHCLNTGLKNQP